MKLVCSYCAKALGTVPGGRPTDVSHGMCEPCSRHFERLWEGMALGEYLDDLPQAVVVVDGDARVLAANARAGALLGRDPASPRGLLGGEAMACARSRLPGGCGKTVHCRECAIRNTVAKVAASGRPATGVPAFLQRDGERVALELSARPLNGAVEVTLSPADGEPQPKGK
jgi:PAS domain-containing protein